MATNVVRFPKQAPVQEKKKTKKAKGLMPDGRYRVMVELDRNPDGSRNRVPCYGQTYAKAKEAADDMKKAQREGQNLAGAYQTVGEWAAVWLETYGKTAGYAATRANKLYVKQLAATDLGKMALKDVRDVHVQMFANAQSGRSKSAVGKIRSVVGRVFGKAVANRMIVFDPTSSIRWTSKGAGTHRALDDREIGAIVAGWRKHRAGLSAMLMLFAGLRRGEALALQWEDIDMDAQIIHVRHGVHYEGNRPVRGAPKTKAGVRDVPILPPLIEAFAGFYGPPRTAYVLAGTKHQPMSRAAWERAWGGLCAALGSNGEPFPMRAHDLRHTFCTMLFDSGVDLKTAQYVMGHEDAAMTMEVYTHLTNTRKTQSVDGLKKWCSKWCSSS